MPFGIGTTEFIIIGVIAVLLFGNRLPSVARSMGRSLTEFKKGIAGLEDGIKGDVNDDPADSINYDDHHAPTTPAFTPPKTEAEASAKRREEAGSAS